MGGARLFWLRFLWLALGWRYVVLTDTDGEMSARLMRGYGDFLFARRFGFGIANIRLLPEGRTEGKAYLKKWELLFGFGTPTPLPGEQG